MTGILIKKTRGTRSLSGKREDTKGVIGRKM